MTEELSAASKLLEAAIQQYAAACSALATRRDLNDLSQGVNLDVILDELEIAKSHRLGITRAEVSLAQARNGIHSLVPIRRLSSEVLIVIFGLAVTPDGPSPYSTKPKTDAHKAFSVSQPEVLTHVCSWWRCIGLDLPWLWSRVAVPFKNSAVGCRLLERAKTFVERARELPLDVHFFDPIKHPMLYINENISQFCGITATRIRSLCLSPSKDFGSHHVEALRSIFANSVPGTLTELVLRGDYKSDTGLSARATNESDVVLPQDIEDRLALVETLRLTGTFFRWDSQAYQGLSELHLQPLHQDSTLSLTDLQLRNILTTAPRLRVFHFGLKLSKSTLGHSSYEAVQLNELEELNLGRIGLNGYLILFGLFSVGPKPLDLSLVVPSQGILALKEDFELFLTHSKVRRLYLRFMDNSSCNNQIELAHLFGHLPNVEALALTGIDIGLDACDHPKEAHDPLPTGLQLSALVLVNCRIDLGYLRRLTEVVPIRSIKLAYCSARSNSPSEGGCFFRAAGFYREIGDIIPTYRFFTLPGAARHYSERAVNVWDPWS